MATRYVVHHLSRMAPDENGMRTSCGGRNMVQGWCMMCMVKLDLINTDSKSALGQFGQFTRNLAAKTYRLIMTYHDVSITQPAVNCPWQDFCNDENLWTSSMFKAPFFRFCLNLQNWGSHGGPQLDSLCLRPFPSHPVAISSHGIRLGTSSATKFNNWSSASQTSTRTTCVAGNDSWEQMGRSDILTMETEDLMI